MRLKTKYTIISVLFLCQALFLVAEDVTFPAGSLIIPMDSQTQDTDNNGIFQAYGLIYHLLVNGVAVHMAVDESKPTVDSPDFTLNELTLIEVVAGLAVVPVDPIPKSYSGGPLIIDATKAQTVLDQIALESPSFDSVVIHKVLGPITVPIRATYEIQPRKIALLNNQNQEGISLLGCYLRLAGIPDAYYDLFEPDMILSGGLTVADYYILWLPHWLEAEEGIESGPLFSAIKGFVDQGGNLLATCKSIDTLESDDPIHTTNDLGINGVVTPERVYHSLDLPFSQIGDYPFEPDLTNDTQSMRNFRSQDTPATGHEPGNPSSWQPNHVMVVGDATPDDPWVFYGIRRKDSDPNKGNTHYIAGHRYVSCEPIISPGLQYRIDTTMSRCDLGDGDLSFWQHEGESMTITLQYDGGDGELVIGPLFENTYDTWENNDFIAHTTEEETNYGPGCNGVGPSRGTDHLAGLMIQNISQYPRRIENIVVEWDCGVGCVDTFQFEQFDIRIDEGECGNAACEFCSDVYSVHYSPQDCQPDGQVSFVPGTHADSNLNLIFEEGSVVGEPGDITARPINVGGIRYILNTLFNSVVDPINIKEFARSGAVIYDDVAYFGTFEYPNNAGHFRAYPLLTENGETVASLVPKWDANAFGIMPAWSDRNLFTFFDGTRMMINTNPSTVERIEAYIDDPNDTLEGVEEDIKNFLGHFLAKRLGGIEHSTPAIVPPNSRTNSTRQALAYVGTTYGVLEQISLETGEEVGGYVPAAMLKHMNNIGLNDPNRPKVDASPTVLDAYLPENVLDPNNARTWKTVMVIGHGSGAAGVSTIDITDPSDVKLLWENFDASLVGNVKRASISRYKKDFGETQVLGYVTAVPSNLPGGHGIKLQAFDLQTGESIWEAPFIQEYETSVNDVPAPVAIFDKNKDNFGDRLLVGDLSGKLWQVDLNTGLRIAPHGTDDNTVPLLDAGPERPIGAAPSVGIYKGNNIVVVGTGGTDWAVSDNNLIYVYDLDVGRLVMPPIPIGRYKLFSPVSIANDQLFFIVVEGTLNSADPNLDIAPEDGLPHAFIYSIPLDPDNPDQQAERRPYGKSSGSAYMKNGQTATVTNDGKIELFGDKKTQDLIQFLKQIIWRDLSYIR